MTEKFSKKDFLFLPKNIISFVVRSYFNAVKKSDPDNSISISKSDKSLNEKYKISINNDVFKWKSLSIKE